MVVSFDRSSLGRRSEAYDLRGGKAVTELVKLGSRPVLALLNDRLTEFFDSARTLR